MEQETRLSVGWGFLAVGLMTVVTCFLLLQTWTPPDPALLTTREGNVADAALADRFSVITGCNRLGWRLFEELRHRPGNLLFSPLSLATGLVMASGATEGETEGDLLAMFGFDLPRERLHPALGSLMNDLNGHGELSVVNRLWGRAGPTYRQEFQQITRGNYGFGFVAIDMVTDPEMARQEINTWVADQSHDSIREILPPGGLAGDEPMLLTCTAYFRGDWRNKFSRKLSTKEPFHLDESDDVIVSTMNTLTGRFAYREHEWLQVLEMPYIPSTHSMILLLPRDISDMERLESTIDERNLASWLPYQGAEPKPGNVVIPKFRLESSLEVRADLEEMGMGMLFREGADFSGAVEDDPELHLAAIHHKVAMEVDEEGTRAESPEQAMEYTSAELVKPPEFVFKADHPFLILIRDNITGSILFIGRVATPIV